MDENDSIETALALHQQGQLDQAEAIYKKILKADPYQVDALQLLATIAMQQNDSVAAVDLFDQAIRINPNYVMAHNGHGNALSNLNRYEEALDSYDRALKIDPNFAEALNNRGNSLFNLERYKDALDQYDRALKIKPDYVDALKNRGNVLHSLKRYEEALEISDLACKMEENPTSAEFHNNLGGIYHEQGKLGEAADCFRKAILLKSDYAEAYNNLGSVVFSLGQLQDATAHYLQAVTLRPKYVVAWNNLGIVLEEQSELEEAEKCFRLVLELAPDNISALKKLAGNLISQGRLVEGEELNQKAAKLSSPGAITGILPAAVLRSYRIRSLFQECILICVVNRLEGWWCFQEQHVISQCQSTPLLRFMLRELVLIRAGDTKAYLRLTRQLDQLEDRMHAEDTRLSAIVECFLKEQRSERLSVQAKGDRIWPVPNEVRLALWQFLPYADMRLYPEAIPHQDGVSAMMDGLLALHAAETHLSARAMAADLRASALAIWEYGYECISASTDSGQIYQITRMLWHFDLLPEARDCQARFSPHSILCTVIDDWYRVRQENEHYAVTLRERTGRQNICHVVGITVWGHAYLDFFLKFHVPSLLAEGNLPHLSRIGQLIISIVTDAEGRRIIVESGLFPVLNGMADVRFSMIEQLPSRESAMNPYFYMHYGLLDHHHVYLAHYLNASLVLMPPDTVISKDSFYTLASHIKAGYDCCTIACIEAYKDEVLPSLERFRSGVALPVDSDALAAIAVQHKTDYFRSITFREGQRLNAYPREFFWRVQGGYICHSIFMHPVILSARVMSRKFNPSHENVDFALLPRAMQEDGRIKVLDDSGELFILHCSDSNPREQEVSSFDGRISQEFGTYMLSINLHNFPVHRELFRKPQFFPVDDMEVPISARYQEESANLLAIFDMAAGFNR